MPLPLFLAIAASMAAAGGIGTGVHGAVKMKGANDTMKAAEERHNENIQRFESCNETTAGSMDKLGNLELDILASFEKFSDILEQIQNRPSFREFACDSVTLPRYDKEELSRVSVGAGVLLGGLGGAALGTAGGFAAAGATTAAVTALGTASTGTAIASLSGAAATNATLAALGGGALAAGGGGVALGTTMLGVTTLGVGLLVGGVMFNIAGVKLSQKADKAYEEMLAAEKEINRICAYLEELDTAATEYYATMERVNEIYRRHLSALDGIVNLIQKTDWQDFTPRERLVTQNTVLLVQLLYKMCQVKIVLKTETEETLNRVNKADVEENIRAANTLMAELGFEGKKEEKWPFNEQESNSLAAAAILYYFAGCDNCVSEEETAVIEEVINPVMGGRITGEVTRLRQIKPLTFAHLVKYLEHVSVEALNGFGTLIEQVIVASDGVNAAEKEAQEKFAAYLQARKMG